MSQNKHQQHLFSNPRAWLMFALGALFYFYEYLLQVSPSVMVSELMRSFDITAYHTGYFAAVYFWTYAPLQIIVGILLDKYGPHRLLTAATGACALGTLMFTTTEIFSIALMGRALIGFGSAFAVVGCMKIISNWFPQRYFALLLGLILTVGMMGAMAGQAPLKLMMEHFADWRHCMYLLAGGGIVLMILMLLFLRDQPQQPSYDTTHLSEPPKSNTWVSLRSILLNPQSWIVALFGGLMFAPTAVLGSFLGVRFIANSYNMTEVSASSLMIVLFIGWALGSPLVGWFSDKIQRRLPTMIVGSACAMLLMCIILYQPLSKALLVVALFCFGFFSSGFLSSFAIIKEINPEKYDATALGFMNTVNMLGGALIPPFIGYLLDCYWTGEKINGEPFYAVADYQAALLVLPITLLLALLLTPFIQETYCRRTDSPLEVKTA